MPRDGTAQPETAFERSGRMANGSQGQFRKIKARQRESDVAWLDDQRRRDCCQLEQAKRYLRSLRYIVTPGSCSDQWHCGLRLNLTESELIGLAKRLGCPFERTIYEGPEARSRQR